MSSSSESARTRKYSGPPKIIARLGTIEFWRHWNGSHKTTFSGIERMQSSLSWIEWLDHRFGSRSEGRPGKMCARWLPMRAPRAWLRWNAAQRQLSALTNDLQLLGSQRHRSAQRQYLIGHRICSARSIPRYSISAPRRGGSGTAALYGTRERLLTRDRFAALRDSYYEAAILLPSPRRALPERRAGDGLQRPPAPGAAG